MEALYSREGQAASLPGGAPSLTVWFCLLGRELQADREAD